MEVTKYPPPVAEPYVLSAVRFDPWPFVDTYVALDPTVVRRRIGPAGRLLPDRPAVSWSLGAHNLLVELSDGTTVHCPNQAALDLYLNRTGTP